MCMRLSSTRAAMLRLLWVHCVSKARALLSLRITVKRGWSLLYVDKVMLVYGLITAPWFNDLSHILSKLVIQNDHFVIVCPGILIGNT
jgi:hypothetical protein